MGRAQSFRVPWGVFLSLLPHVLTNPAALKAQPLGFEWRLFYISTIDEIIGQGFYLQFLAAAHGPGDAGGVGPESLRLAGSPDNQSPAMRLSERLTS